MIKLKTISGHYDTVYSIEHNNRSFIPKNVDVRRTPWNYNCVAAGEQAYLNNTEPFHISEFWTRYKDICDLYWQNYSIVQIMAYQQYHEHLEYMRRYSRSTFLFPHNPVEKR